MAQDNLKNIVQQLIDRENQRCKTFLSVDDFEGATYIYHNVQEFDFYDSSTETKYRFPATKAGLKIIEKDGRLDIDNSYNSGQVRVLDKGYKHPCVGPTTDNPFPMHSLAGIVDYNKENPNLVARCNEILVTSTEALRAQLNPPQRAVVSCTNAFYRIDSKMFDEFKQEK